METGRKVCIKWAGSGRRKGGRGRRSKPIPRVADEAVGCRDGGRMIGGERDRRVFRKGSMVMEGSRGRLRRRDRGCSMEADLAGLM